MCCATPSAATGSARTTQVDFNLPERFGAFYIAANSEETTPVMVHRAYLRLDGVLHRHSAARAPRRPPAPRLAPLQIVVCTITSDADDFALQFAAKAKKRGFWVETDLRNEKINYKVREHSLAKVPVLAGSRPQGGGDKTPVSTPAGPARTRKPRWTRTRRSRRWSTRLCRRICGRSGWRRNLRGLRRQHRPEEIQALLSEREFDHGSPDSDEAPEAAARLADERRDLPKGLEASAMKKAHIDALAASWKDDPLPGADAARSQDFMYDEFGIPAGGDDFSLNDIASALPKS